MSTSNGYHHETATLPQAAEHPSDPRVRAAQRLADALASDLDGLAFDLDLILPGAIPAIMAKLMDIHGTLADVHKLMDGATKAPELAAVSRSKRKRR